MNPRHLTRIAFLAASKRLGGMRVHGRRSVSQQFNQAKSRHLRVGQLRQQANALGRSTFHEYDLFGREVYTWGPATYPTVQGYDTYGQRNLLRTFRDTSADFSNAVFPLNATGDTTTWAYDEATGVLLQKTYADNKGPTYTYYADGLLKTRTWARKDANNNPLTTTYIYNTRGSLLQVDYSDLTPDVTYTYNALGQQTIVTDGSGTRNYTYDSATQALTQEIYTGTLNGTLNRAYDTYARPTGYSLIEVAAATDIQPATSAIRTAAKYIYDANGNFSQVQGDTIPSQLAASLAGTNVVNLTPSTFTYNRLIHSELISTVIGHVHTVTNTYESNRDVLTTKQNRVTIGPNTNSIISRYDYTVNAIGQRVSRTQSGTAFDGIGYAPGTQLPPNITGTPSSGTSTDIFNYNTRGEVINSTNNIQNALARSYSYDPIGNRLTATEGDINNPATNPSAKTYTTNSLNQYTQINTTLPPPPTTVQPTYDDDGNMLAEGTGKVYTWDCENRLIQVNLPNGEIVKYYYDSSSHRIKREYHAPSNTTTTTYHYDDWNVIAETTTVTAIGDSEVSSTTAITKTYHWGLDLSGTLQEVGGVGGLLSSKTTTGETITQHHYTYDANGNVSELINGEGSISAHYQYDPFGNTVSSTGTNALTNTCCFSTKFWDDQTGLIYYGYRFYNCQLGRWINRDFFEEGGGFNPNSFVGNEALSQIDLKGLVSWSEIKEGIYAPVKSSLDRVLKEVEIFLGEVVGKLKNEFIVWNSHAKLKGQWSSDEREKRNFGLINFQSGRGYKIASDGCCVSVEVGRFFAQLELKSPPILFGIGLVGRGSFSLGGKYKYCWFNGDVEWDAFLRVSFSGGFQASWGAIGWIGGAKVTAELGFGFSNTFSFKEEKWSGWKKSGYIRAYAEWKIGFSYNRKEFRFNLSEDGGDVDVF